MLGSEFVTKIGNWLRKFNDDAGSVQISGQLANHGAPLLFQVRFVYEQKCLPGIYSRG